MYNLETLEKRKQHIIAIKTDLINQKSHIFIHKFDVIHNKTSQVPCKNYAIFVEKKINNLMSFSVGKAEQNQNKT